MRFVLRESRNRAALDAYLDAYYDGWQVQASTGKPWEVIVQPESTKRSSKANRFYRAMLTDIEEQSVEGGRRFSASGWHEFHKQEFIGIVDLPNGKQIGQSSTDLSSGEFSAFCEKVMAYHANKYGVIFTEPEGL